MDDWPNGVAQEDVAIEEKNSPLLYSVEESPPILLSLILGIQVRIILSIFKLYPLILAIFDNDRVCVFRDTCFGTRSLYPSS